MGLSVAIPLDRAMGAVKQLKATGKVSRGMIGVTLQEIDAETAKGPGLPDTHGALINDVTPGCAGEKSGLGIVDVVRSMVGIDIRQSSDMPPLVGAQPPSTGVVLGTLARQNAAWGTRVSNSVTP